jgi:hypothetical protein
MKAGRRREEGGKKAGKHGRKPEKGGETREDVHKNGIVEFLLCDFVYTFLDFQRKVYRFIV